jgi:hypothetical protein
VHLSEDPEHRPAARAHVAVDYGAELSAVERRLQLAALTFRTSDAGDGLRVAFCKDPAGNRWELRGFATTA